MKSNGKPNTFIGGIGLNVTTPALLAVHLGISASRISKFKLIGNDIECRVSGGSYVLPVSAFNNVNGRFLTYFRDEEGLVTDCLLTCFKTVTNPISVLYFPAIITLTGTSLFQDSAGPTLFDLPNCTTLPIGMAGNWNGTGKTLNFPSVVNYGPTQGNDAVFAGNNRNNVTINANSINQTSNGGGVEGDLQWVIDGGTATINWV